MSSLHPSQLRITVVEDLDWPALHHGAILTPNSLWPQDITLDDALSVSRLTPNSSSGKSGWPKTPTTSHTFGFPLSARSTGSKFPPEGPESHTPLEKHKRRLRRYHAAESRLVRLPAPPPSSPLQLRAEAVHYAARHVAAHLADARQCLRAIRVSGRRDNARWMAEQRLATLESLQADLKKSSVVQVGDSAEDSVRRREANLVQFLGVRRGEGDGLVPVFTRTRGRHPSRPPVPTPAEMERRCMTVGSPMKLQLDGPPIVPTSRREWPWETRVRSVLLYPAPPKPPESESPFGLRSETPMTATPTSGSFSPVEPETPLTELEDNDEEGGAFEDYPTFKSGSRRSQEYTPAWQQRRAPASSSRLPPLRMSASRLPTHGIEPVTPEEDEDEEDDDGYQDNYEAYPTFKPAARHSRAYPPLRAPPPSARLPSPPRHASESPIDPETDEDDDDGYEDNYEDYPTFFPDSALSLSHARAPPPPQLARVRTSRSDLAPDTTYAWLADSATWAAPPAWHGDGWEVGPASASSVSSSSSAASSSTASPTSFTPRTPVSRAAVAAAATAAAAGADADAAAHARAPLLVARERAAAHRRGGHVRVEAAAPATDAAAEEGEGDGAPLLCGARAAPGGRGEPPAEAGESRELAECAEGARL
ncbi:hypothetical protein DFH09DRAFT_1166948, partial [Mycena vulgaris]